jgi:uncharacterized protein with PIN domain
VEEIQQALVILSNPLVISILSILVITVLAIRLRYQRCPHCRRLVVRARHAWVRCRRCGREYYRGLHTVR